MTTRITAFASAPLVTLVLLGTACDEPLPTEALHEEPAVVGPVAASHARAPEALPLHIMAGATLEAQELAPGFGPPTFGRSTFDGRCSSPADFVISFAVAGQATHLGRFTASAEHCSQLDFQTGATSAITDGVMTFTAANGDQLWDHYQRGAAPAEDHEFVGGTGRFAGATGQGTAFVSCNRQAGTCTFELTGALQYDASDRSK